jgi:hypothetical protein
VFCSARQPIRRSNSGLERSPDQPLQGNQGHKDKRDDPDESDGEEDVLHGDQDLLSDQTVYQSRLSTSVNSITRCGRESVYRFGFSLDWTRRQWRVPFVLARG